MGGFWPASNRAEKKEGWTLSVPFLRSVKKLMDETGDSGSLEVIENCLLAASRVEIENYNKDVQASAEKCPNCVMGKLDIIIPRCSHCGYEEYSANSESLCRECGSETDLVGVEHPLCDDCAKRYR